MPPKKKKRIDTGVKQGTGRQYIIDNFSEVTDTLLNGHVLYIYLENGSSFARTEEVVMRVKPSSMSTKYLVRRLVTTTLGKFQKLTDPKEFGKFQMICHQSFGITTPTSARATLTTIGHSATAGPSTATSSSDTPSTITRQSSADAQFSIVGPSSSTAPSIIIGPSSSTAPSIIIGPSSSTAPSIIIGPSSSTAPSIIIGPSSSTAPSIIIGSSTTTHAAAPFASIAPSACKVASATTVPPAIFDSSTTTVTPRSCMKCPALRVRLAKSLRVKRDIVVRYRSTIAQMKQTQSKKTSHTSKTIKLKVLNQKLKRKNKQLQKIKNAQDISTQATQLDNVRLELRNTKRKLRRLQEKFRAVSLPVPNEASRFKETLKSKEDAILHLENRTMLLEEEMETSPEIGFSKPGRTFPTNMRRTVYDLIINQVPTKNIPIVIRKVAANLGTPAESVPNRSTVEVMARELGVISEIQTAEAILKNKHVTLGFDATTQEGVHINSVHVTTVSSCYVIAVDELPGGTAIDYSDHICQSIDNLASRYSEYTGTEFQTVRTNIIDNISNCMMDRVAANHAAIVLVNEAWHKTINELNCHLHPLDTIASSSRSALRQLETSSGKLFGKDCFAANIVVQMNKLRYKDGKGDPRGFKSFLDSEDLPRGFIPRYRGNRLHVLFHICGKYVDQYDAFVRYLKSGTACGGLRAAILHDFETDTAKLEMQVLGLFGKLLTGPWMQMFYTSAESDISHVDGIDIIKKVIAVLRDHMHDPARVLTSSCNFFGGNLDTESDRTLRQLLQPPSDLESFSGMMKSVMAASVTVLDRQYKNYFGLDVSERLAEETRSARSHNMDAEEIMGMFSALQKKSPHATICFLSCKMRAQKNRTGDFLNEMEELERDALIRFATPCARRERQRKRVRQCSIQAEMSARIATKRQEKEGKDRKQAEKLLKTTTLADVATRYHLETSKQDDIANILEGKVIGQSICHTWSEDGMKVVYNGKLEKLRAKSGMYTVGYWSQTETYADAVDYNVSMYELAVDMIFGDLVLC